MIRHAVIFSMAFLFFCSCTNDPPENREIQIKQDKELMEIKPKKPVKVELKRKENGAYTWDITGEDVDKIIEADRKLRKSFQSYGVKEER